MSRASIREQAYARLAQASADYFASPRTQSEKNTLLEVWRDVGRLKLSGAFDEAFVLLPLGNTSKATLDYLYGGGTEHTAFHPSRAVFFTLPVIVLNEGNSRAGMTDERQLRDLLDDFPVIDGDTIDSILAIVRDAPFNGASVDEVGAFLLNHAGERITAEYR